MKKSVLLFMACLLLFAGGCTQQNPKKEKAEAFLKKAFTAPTEDFVKAQELMLDEGDIEGYEKAVQKALQALGKGLADESLLADSGNKLSQNLIYLQLEAAAANVSYTDVQVELTESGENNFRYAVTFTRSGQEEKQKRIGSIQFNGQGLINYFTVETPSKTS